MQATVCGFAIALVLLSVTTRAQEFEDAMTAVELALEDGESKAALGLLLAQEGAAQDEESLQRLLASLTRIDAALQAASSFVDLLAARNAGLRLQRRLHGDRDHRDVAVSLENLAHCLHSFGHADEALRHFEAAVAMRENLGGERDDPDVARCRNGVAACLLAGGRMDEALAQFEAVLAMRRRLFGDADHVDVARALLNLGGCLDVMRRFDEALVRYEEALAMQRRLFGGRDHAEVAVALQNIAMCKDELGRSAEALPIYREALGMLKRVHGGGDHPDIATTLANLAYSTRVLGSADEALLLFEQALAMQKRLFGEADNSAVAFSTANLAACHLILGRQEEARPLFEQSLAMWRRLIGDRDHPAVAWCLCELGQCFEVLGEWAVAMAHHEQALAMQRRLVGNRDHAEVAACLNNVAYSLQRMGRSGEALQRAEQALQMYERVFRGGDHPEMAKNLNNVADCLDALGRAGEALPHHQRALAMQRRLFGDVDHVDVARTLNSVGCCLQVLGSVDEALERCEQALAMQQRLSSDRDHADVAGSLGNVASCLFVSHKYDAALQRCQESLAMWKRVCGDRDHTDLTAGMNNLANCLVAVGRQDEALQIFEDAMAMWARLYGRRDHACVVKYLNGMAACLQKQGRVDEALQLAEQAAAMIERLRRGARVSTALQQSLFDSLKEGSVFERLQRLAIAAGRPADALLAAERSRGRELLDLLEQQEVDPLQQAVQRAQQHGDDASAQRLGALQQQLTENGLEGDRLLRDLARLDDAPAVAPDGKRASLLEQSDSVSLRRRQLLDEQAGLLGDALPVGHVSGRAEIQAILRDGELLLEFTVAEDGALLYVLGDQGDLEVVELRFEQARLQSALSALLASSSHAALVSPRGRDPEAANAGTDAIVVSRQLFTSLIPQEVWRRIRTSKRVFVAAHRELHRLPFELLVADVKDGRPVHWLDSGPPVAYVPSGSTLHWLRTRRLDVEAAGLDVLVVGDPKLGATKLPQLKGARAEAEAIAAACRKRDGTAEVLLGEEATELAVFGSVAKAKYVHFACHGIAEEYAGQSLSMLVLAQSRDVLPGDDGFLKLSDLLHAWRARLPATHLVVLSACSTNVGPTLRDEAPQALPLGFLFAGAPAVISSLWAVDDASTKELMVDFYSRLLAGETDRLKAFTDAKKTLRAKYPDPFHWAPFLYMGTPE